MLLVTNNYICFMEKEIWLPVPDFNEFYEVSNMGNVRGLFYGGKKRKEPKNKKIQINKNGYCYVVLQNGLKVKAFTVHRLVLSVFDKPMPKNIDCCHKDHNRLNNKLNNLEWGTRFYNESEKRKACRIPLGEKNGASKLNNETVIKIREMYSNGYSTNKIAEKLNLKQQNVWNICLRKTWKHL